MPSNVAGRTSNKYHDYFSFAPPVVAAFGVSARCAACGCTSRRHTKILASREAARIQKNLHTGSVTIFLLSNVPYPQYSVWMVEKPGRGDMNGECVGTCIRWINTILSCQEKLDH